MLLTALLTAARQNHSTHSVPAHLNVSESSGPLGVVIQGNIDVTQGSILGEHFAEILG